MAEQATVVTLGGRTYAVRPVPLKRIREVQQLVPALARVVAEANPNDPAQVVQALLDALLQLPYEALRIFIPDLESREQLEEATVPQLIDAFQTVAQVNRLDALKNVLAPLLTTLPSNLTSSSSSSPIPTATNPKPSGSAFPLPT